jgi:hypothetical protein
MLNENQNFEMTTVEQFEAIARLKQTLEDNFVSLGELLSRIKRKKTYKAKGYKDFKEFIETEFQLSNSFANKLISIYELYIEDLDVDEKSVKEIGLDKLNMIKPLVKDAAFSETEEWLKKAESLTNSKLRDEVKTVREKKKEKNMKEIFTEQYVERMVTYFNCSRKELDFKLALFFQDKDLDEMMSVIKKRQREFQEQENGDLS